MILKDDRTEEQQKSHTWLVIGTDRILSHWGQASGGLSYAAWACVPEDRKPVLEWVESRGDMRRVREVSEAYNGPYRPDGCAHLHIYVVEDDHPAVRRAREFAKECAR